MEKRSAPTQGAGEGAGSPGEPREGDVVVYVDKRGGEHNAKVDRHRPGSPIYDLKIHDGFNNPLALNIKEYGTNGENHGWKPARTREELTDKQKRSIEVNALTGMDPEETAWEYGVTPETMRTLHKEAKAGGRTWRDLEYNKGGSEPVRGGGQKAAEAGPARETAGHGR